ncbi:hypothetical protein FA95DRAFT_868297 [Auriscalpium vulgare]|uniref:Uncharacterized protein n=1 Tax=Auriscalpium vulgare TaxID=40419 RepID=A0ACB8R958_9AGAM|nr:hypothetical protein FA95DRAFT_868297 [Auriscalpium vulgare]
MWNAADARRVLAAVCCCISALPSRHIPCPSRQTYPSTDPFRRSSVMLGCCVPNGPMSVLIRRASSICLCLGCEWDYSASGNSHRVSQICRRQQDCRRLCATQRQGQNLLSCPGRLPQGRQNATPARGARRFDRSPECSYGRACAPGHP